MLDRKKPLLLLSLACGQDASPLYKDKDVVLAYLCQDSGCQDWRSMAAKDFAGAGNHYERGHATHRRFGMKRRKTVRRITAIRALLR